MSSRPRRASCGDEAAMPDRYSATTGKTLHIAKPLSASSTLQPPRACTSARIDRFCRRRPRSMMYAGVSTPETSISGGGATMGSWTTRSFTSLRVLHVPGQAALAELFHERVRVELLHVEDALAPPLAGQHHRGA